MTTVIATTFDQMVKSQSTLTEWARGKLEAEKKGYEDLTYTRDRLKTGDFSTVRIDRQIAQARRRISFYGKVLAALRAGYTIVPSMASEVFAVKAPDKVNRSWKPHYSIYSTPPRLPVRAHEIGEGNYVSPAPFDEIEKTGEDDKGRDRLRIRFTEHDDVAFPIEAQRPELIEAVTAAMKTKIFDALGIVGGRALNTSDPILVGHIKTPRQYRPDTMFLIGWFVDTDTI